MAVIIAELDGQVRQGNEQCELVRGGEVAFSEEALQLGEKGELFLRRRWSLCAHPRCDQ